METNKDSKTMADLLRKGYTMLNLACPICNNPIFKNKEDKLFCAICNRNILIKDKMSVNNSDSIPITKNRNTLKKETLDLDTKLDYNLISSIINEKISGILDIVKSETQLEKLEIEIKIIEQMLNLLETIKHLHISPS